ncbi:hypothetical protein [Thiolinea disciformis]|uniref:hypothetical protein n=1 Tax=Thiolinea disciformis TaxID=125614 RepID=UPI00038249E2|nr:hypothetical protein [Thiolinea disciformis]
MNTPNAEYHRNAGTLHSELELINSLLQLAADTLAHHAIIEVDHVRQALQFAANKAWEQSQSAKKLAADLHDHYVQAQGVRA